MSGILGNSPIPLLYPPAPTTKNLAKAIGGRRNAPAVVKPPGRTNPNSYDPAKDPVVADGPPGSGTVRTRSGRLVDTTMGAYVGGNTPPPGPVHDFVPTDPHDPGFNAHPVTTVPVVADTRPASNTPHDTVGAYVPPVRTTQSAGDTTPKDTAPGPYGALGSQFEKLLMDSMKGLVNPKAYAHGAANAEYDGALGSLARQIRQNPVDEEQHQFDLTNWYDQLGGTLARGAKQSAADYTNAGKGLGSNLSGLAEALGGAANPAAYGLGTAGANEMAGLTSDAASTAAFNDSMKGLFAGEGVAAHQNEQNRMAQGLFNLKGSQTDMLHQKGASLAKYLADGQQNRTAQMGAIQNMILGAQTAGSDIALKKAQVTGAEGANTLQKLQIEQARKLVKAGGGSWASLASNPQAKASLASQLRKTVTSFDKGGTPLRPPKQLFNKFAGIISASGLDPAAPEGQQMILGILRSLFPNANKFPFAFLDKK